MKHKKSIFLFFRKYFLSPNIHSYFILAKKAWLAILNFSWFIVSYYLLSNSWLFINLYKSLVFIKLFYRRNQWLLLSFPMYILCNNECVLFYILFFREKNILWKSFLNHEWWGKLLKNVSQQQMVQCGDVGRPQCPHRSWGLTGDWRLVVMWPGLALMTVAPSAVQSPALYCPGPRPAHLNIDLHTLHLTSLRTSLNWSDQTPDRSDYQTSSAPPTPWWRWWRWWRVFWLAGPDLAVRSWPWGGGGVRPSVYSRVRPGQAGGTAGLMTDK